MDVPMQEPRGIRAGRIGRASSMAGTRLREKLMGRVQKVRLASRVILVGLLVSFAGLLWLNQMSTIVSLGYDMQTIDKKVVELNRKAELLQSQVATYENLKRIEDEAKGRLGMIPANKYVYVKIPVIADQNERGRDNPKLYPVNDWWRDLTEMLPRPWQNSVPTNK